MTVTKFPRTIKLVVIGASGVGKTSIRGRYISQRFSTGYRATIGADFITKVVKVDDSEEGETVALQIWDTAGQERFSSLSSAFFRGADAAILVFDVNTRETMHALEKWWDEFKVHAPLREEDGDVGSFCVVLVGNKVDLEGDMDVVSHEEAGAFMDKLVPPELYREEDEDEDDPLAASQMTARPTTPAIAYPSSPLQSPHSSLTPHSRAQSKSVSPHRRKSRSKSTGPRPYASSSVSGLSIYHTPSSSVYDQFESARGSPELSGSYPPMSIGSLSTGNLSAVTLTPNNWGQFDPHHEDDLNDHMTRTRGTLHSVASSASATESFYSAFSTRPGGSSRERPSTPQSQSHSPLHSNLHASFQSHSHSLLRSSSHPHLHSHTHSRPHSPSLLKLPSSPLRTEPLGTSSTANNISSIKGDALAGPRLFFASAKTGEGIPDVFEYVARRVVRRWDYEYSLEREREEEEEERALNGHGNGVYDGDREYGMRLGSGGRNGKQRQKQHGVAVNGHANGNGIRVQGSNGISEMTTTMRGRAREWTSRANGMSAGMGSCCSS
ncbi:ras-domain-containing protein [Gymnopus androsaceus JB14]|uniref:Ras-domain-containing protein n=1 Tax=Gymnopus androsaceus JB14 TaxID=1447944 RepID=A0A6A4H216_9AGAR|nr:ras-domain-containing protein [Gymnopus androsaceus JB14]